MTKEEYFLYLELLENYKNNVNIVIGETAVGNTKHHNIEERIVHNAIIELDARLKALEKNEHRKDNTEELVEE